MIEISLDGLDDVLETIRNIPTSVDRKPVFEEVAQRFSARLRAATPKGYSGKLRDSVVYYADESGAEVGYEEGVETSGDSSLDSVTRPRTRGRSVLKKWVRQEELESVISESFEAYSSDAAATMEARFVRGIS